MRRTVDCYTFYAWLKWIPAKSLGMTAGGVISKLLTRP